MKEKLWQHEWVQYGESYGIGHCSCDGTIGMSKTAYAQHVASLAGPAPTLANDAWNSTCAECGGIGRYVKDGRTICQECWERVGASLAGTEPPKVPNFLNHPSHAVPEEFDEDSYKRGWDAGRNTLRSEMDRKGEKCGIAEDVITSTNADSTATAASDSDLHLLHEWNALSLDSKEKIKKWFDLSVEYLQNILDAPPVAGTEPPKPIEGLDDSDMQAIDEIVKSRRQPVAGTEPEPRKISDVLKRHLNSQRDMVGMAQRQPKILSEDTHKGIVEGIDLCIQVVENMERKREAEIAALREQLAAKDIRINFLMESASAEYANTIELQEELAAARQNALEEAASILDMQVNIHKEDQMGLQGYAQSLADEIRALKTSASSGTK